MTRKANSPRIAVIAIVTAFALLNGGVAHADAWDAFTNLLFGGEVYFGDDSSRWARDGECDDSRFVGEGRSVITSADHQYADASDCRNLFEAGSIRLADTSLANTDFSGFEAGQITHSDEMIDGKHYDAYTFYGAAGQEVAIDLRSDDFDTFLELRSPRGLYWENDDFGFFDITHSRLVVRLAETGTHEVIVRSYGNDEVGNYTLTIDVSH